MKRILFILMACLLVVSVSAGCGEDGTSPIHTPVPTPTSPSTPVELTDAEYIDIVDPLMKKHKASVEAANEIIALQTELMVSGDEYMSCEIIRISMGSFIEECQGINNQWSAINPPSNFAVFHRCFSLWSGAEIEAFELIEEAAGSHKAADVTDALAQADGILSLFDDVSVCETLYEEALAGMAEVTATPGPTPSTTMEVTPTPISTHNGFPGIQWSKTFSGGSGVDIAYSARQTSDGGYIVAGFMSGMGSMGWQKDLGLLKLDGNGTVEWRWIYGASDPDEAYAAQQTSDGGYIIVGSTGSYMEAGSDIWLIKLDERGQGRWSRTFGSPLLSEKGIDGKQTSDGGYIVAGIGASGLSADFWLIKTNDSGQEEWRKIYGGADHHAAGCVQQTTDSGYIVAGARGIYGTEEYDFWLLKVNKGGVEQWEKTFGGSGEDEARSVQQTSDGGYIVAGYAASAGAGGRDLWVVKTDGKGEEKWNRTYGGTEDDEAYSIQQTYDGGYIIAGSTESYGEGGKDLWLLKIDSSGNEEWNRPLGGHYDDWAQSIEPTADGGYIIAGAKEEYSAGGINYWVIKLKP